MFLPPKAGAETLVIADTPSSEICSPPKRSLPLQHKPKSLETNSTPGGALRQFLKISVLQKRTPLLVVPSVNSLKFQSCKFTWLSSGCRIVYLYLFTRTPRAAVPSVNSCRGFTFYVSRKVRPFGRVGGLKECFTTCIVRRTIFHNIRCIELVLQTYFLSVEHLNSGNLFP